jgi:hypothetical protein
MNTMPGFTAENALHVTGRYHFAATGAGCNGGKVVPQLTRDQATAIRADRGYGSVICYPSGCATWSTGFDGNIFCSNPTENCYWWPTFATAA